MLFAWSKGSDQTAWPQSLLVVYVFNPKSANKHTTKFTSSILENGLYSAFKDYRANSVDPDEAARATSSRSAYFTKFASFISDTLWDKVPFTCVAAHFKYFRFLCLSYTISYLYKGCYSFGYYNKYTS